MSSLSKQLTFDIEKIIDTYVNLISEKYSIDKVELQRLWTGGQASTITTSSNPVVDMQDLSLERLLKCSKNELSALCKSHGKKCTGKKDELISRLRESNTESEETKQKPINSKQPLPKQTVPKPVVSKTSVSAEHKTNVIKALTSNVLAISVRTNAFGNTEHSETHLIFDKKTKKVIGRQEDDGTISDLCDEDIENCKKYKFPYEIPTNLDKRDSLAKVKVKELEDDDDIKIQEEEIDIEEEDGEDEVVEEEEEVEDQEMEEEEEVEEIEE